MVLRPVGPLPARVYWVRRVLVLAVVLAVVWAGYQWLGPSPSSDPDPTPTASASATPTPTPTPTSASPTPTPTKTKSRSSSPEAAPCSEDVIAVAVAVDAETFPAGEQPQFTLTVTNGGKKPCVRDLGPGALELRVSSGGARVWSSDDCNASVAQDPTTLDGGQTFTQTVSWDRRASQPGCPAGQPLADPGQYQVIARNGDLLSEPATFTLE